MPWKETDVGSERIRFVVEALRGEESMTLLCRRYGISRKTGHKWLDRARSVGSLSEVVEQSRRPHRSPAATSPIFVSRVVALRERHGWGSRKLQVLLAEEGIRLGRRTIDRILEREGLLEEARRNRPAVHRFERAAPNELTQMDFKGWYPVGGTRRCYPLSLVDDHSRFGLALAALPTQHGKEVQSILVETFERYGVPEAMLVDHGTPWWSSTNGHGLTRLSVWLIRQGVHLLFSGIAHPQTQGKVERFHRTLAEWLRFHGTPKTLTGFAAALTDFLDEYNYLRPHEALELDRPAQHYRPSPRSYQPNPPAWEYPSGSDVRRLSGSGNLWDEGKYHFVCHALGNERVRCDSFDQRLLVSYRDMYIREIDFTTEVSRTILQPYGPTGHEPQADG